MKRLVVIALVFGVCKPAPAQTTSDCSCADIPPFLRDSGAHVYLKAELPAAFKQLRIGSCANAALAARGLAKQKDTSAIRPLVVALGHHSCRVRTAAADALAALGDTSVVQPLLTAMRDPDPRVRQGVAAALGAIGDPRAASALAKAVRDSSKHVRQAAADALGRLHSRR